MHARQVTQIPMIKTHTEKRIGIKLFCFCCRSFFSLLYFVCFFVFLFFIFSFFLVFFLFSLLSLELYQRKNIELAFHTNRFHFGYLGAIILVHLKHILQFEGPICEIPGFDILPNVVV